MRAPVWTTFFSGFISISLNVVAAYALLALVILGIVAGGVRVAHAYVNRNLIETGPARRDSLTVARAGADSLVADFEFVFGDIAVSAAAADDSTTADDLALSIDYETNVANLHPVASYSITGGVGTLDVTMSMDRRIPNLRRLDEYVFQWDVRLPTEIPLTLNAEMGLGPGTFTMTGLDLRGLTVEGGMGDVMVDLRGTWLRSFTAVIEGGHGQLTLLLPEETGVRVATEAGVGEIQVAGLHLLDEDGSVYVNDAYGQSEVTIDIEAAVGVGEMTLRVLPLGEHFAQE